MDLAMPDVNAKLPRGKRRPGTEESVRWRFAAAVNAELFHLKFIKKIVFFDKSGYQTDLAEHYLNKVDICQG